MLVQETALDITDEKQISEWQLPANLPAGIYIIRTIRQGHNNVYAREVVVQ
jgi:hypothetical protein